MAKTTPTPEEIAVGQRFADLRKAKGITQKGMAEQLGVTQSMVSDYEHGAIRLHGELIIRLTGILGISSDELLGLSKQSIPPVKNKRFYRRFSEINKLPKRDQDVLLRTIDMFISKTS